MGESSRAAPAESRGPNDVVGEEPAPESGARPRDASAVDLVDALRAVRSRGASASGEELSALEGALGAWLGTSVRLLRVVETPAAAVSPDALGPRLGAVASLVLDGLSDKEIAEALGVRHATARTYVQRLCRALGVSGRGGVHRWARAAGVEPRRAAPQGAAQTLRRAASGRARR